MKSRPDVLCLAGHAVYHCETIKLSGDIYIVSTTNKNCHMAEK